MGEIKEKKVFGRNEIEGAVEQLSKLLLEDLPKNREIALIGIATGGVPLADRLAARLRERGAKVETGVLDITFYRDDLALNSRQPVIKRTEIPFNLDNKYVVLVDDVLFSGRTTRAAMDAIVDFGRPEILRLAVLVDRGHRELPIQANFVGLVLKTERSEKVRVCWKEAGDGEDQVLLVKGKG